MAQDTRGILTIPTPASLATSPKDSLRPYVTVVCGPRGSGKTDLVAERVGDGDFVWDYGEIQRTLFPRGDDGNAAKIMGDIKSAVFRHLLGAAVFTKAWLVVQAPGKAERQTYIDRLNAEIIVIEATAAYCADATPWGKSSQGAEVVRNEAIKWWSKYERVPGQEIVIPDV